MIPWATFVEPEVARVGLNEIEAKEKGIAYEVSRYDLDDLETFQLNAAAAAFLPIEEREELIELIAEGFER